MPRSSRSAIQNSRRAAEDRDRRAAESPASRQARLALVKAATRRRRQVLTLESDITAKRRNSSIAENQHLRAEHCRQAAVVAEARCARRDATHNDAFEHLVWLHSCACCSGSLGVMNARRLSHLKNAGASAALEIARQDVLADVQQHIEWF